jgi:uroporphyrinogen-III synthase
VVCGLATARAFGITPELSLDRFSAAAALDLLRPLVQPGHTVLVPRAAESQPELTDGLVALGAHVHAPIAYRTVAVDPSTLVDTAAGLRSGSLSAVTACSPSAVHALAAAVGQEALLMARLICLGETTAQAARQAGLRVDGIAERTTMAALVQAVAAALAEHEVRV